jgi:hypothetical protein
MASLTITITHPQLTRSTIINTTDARMLEFMDALRSHVYGTSAAPVTRLQAADTLLNDLAASARGRYQQAKQAEADAAAIPIPGIDAP